MAPTEAPERHTMSTKKATITVSANPDLDDCLQGAVDEYVAEHPEAAGWDLDPRWGDEDRETVELTVPVVEAEAQSEEPSDQTTLAEWDGEGYWAAIVSPYATRDDLVQAATDAGETIQQHVRACVAAAVDQGADFDAEAAYRDICQQLGVPADSTETQ